MLDVLEGYILTITKIIKSMDTYESNILSEIYLKHSNKICYCLMFDLDRYHRKLMDEFHVFDTGKIENQYGYDQGELLNGEMDEHDIAFSEKSI